MRPTNYIYNGFRACSEQRPNNLTFNQARAAKHSRWIDYNSRGVRTTPPETPRDIRLNLKILVAQYPYTIVNKITIEIHQFFLTWYKLSFLWFIR